MLTMRPIWDYRYKLGIFRLKVGGSRLRGAVGRKWKPGMKNVEMAVVGNIPLLTQLNDATLYMRAAMLRYFK